MAMQDLVWDPIQRSRAPRVPKAFEPELKSILQQKYMTEDLSLSSVQRYIKDNHHLFITDRQLGYRLERYEMFKKSRPGPDRTPTCLNGMGAQLIPETTSVISETTGPAGTGLKLASVQDCRQPFYFHSLAYNTHLGSLDTKHPLKNVKEAESLEPMLDISLLPESVVADNADINTALEGDEDRLYGVGQNAQVAASDLIASEEDEDEQLHQSQVNNHIQFFNDAFYDTFYGMSEITRTLNESSHDTDHLFNTEGLFSHLRGEVRSAVSKAVVARRAHDQVVWMITSIERVSTILGTLFKRIRRGPGPTNMSTLRLDSSERLALVMSCCGYGSDASCCLQFLLCCWNIPAAPALQRNTIADRFSHSTNILTWLLQTNRCDVNIAVCFSLWKSCMRAQRNRNQMLGGASACSLQEVLAIGKLALAAYLQGYDVFFQDVRTFWKLYRNTAAVKTSDMDALSFQVAAVDYTDKLITDPRLLYKSRSYYATPRCTIMAGVAWLLTWVRQQLLLRPVPVELNVVGSQHLWRHIYAREDAGILEQQLLLSYLSYRGSMTNIPWALWLEDSDRDFLPWNICLEWLCGEVPLLTLSILSSLSEPRKEALPDVITPETWSTRMLNCTDRLSRDIHQTTKMFCDAALVACLNHQRSAPPGRRTVWNSPIMLDLWETRKLSVAKLHEPAEHLVWSTAVSGGTVAMPSPEKPSALILDDQDPTLLSTPGSSLSGIRSMKSICARAEDDFMRYCDSPRSSGSLLRGFSLDRLSATSSLLDILMRRRRTSTTMSSSSPSLSSPRDRSASANISDDAIDAMELDIDFTTP